MLKATTASVLALTAALSLAGCGKTPQSAKPAAAPTSPAADAQKGAAMNHPAATPAANVDLTGIAKAEGGKTIAEVYAGKDALANTEVTVRGKVVKANSGIMGKDWLHLRDGSGEEGSNDLTVTTNSTPPAKVGDTVLVKGKVVLNKDFGMGYQYPVILEDADVKIEASAAQ